MACWLFLAAWGWPRGKTLLTIVQGPGEGMPAVFLTDTMGGRAIILKSGNRNSVFPMLKILKDRGIDVIEKLYLEQQGGQSAADKACLKAGGVNMILAPSPNRFVQSGAQGIYLCQADDPLLDIKMFQDDDGLLLVTVRTGCDGRYWLLEPSKGVRVLNWPVNRCAENLFSRTSP